MPSTCSRTTLLPIGATTPSFSIRLPSPRPSAISSPLPAATRTPSSRLEDAPSRRNPRHLLLFLSRQSVQLPRDARRCRPGRPPNPSPNRGPRTGKRPSRPPERPRNGLFEVRYCLRKLLKHILIYTLTIKHSTFMLLIR